MATEFTVKLQNEPGTLARIGTVLGDADVNIAALQGFSRGEESIVQFVTTQPDEVPAGINIDSVYVTTAGQVVLAVDDLAGAIQVAESMTVIDPQ